MSKTIGDELRQLVDNNKQNEDFRNEGDTRLAKLKNRFKEDVKQRIFTGHSRYRKLLMELAQKGTREFPLVHGGEIGEKSEFRELTENDKCIVMKELAASEGPTLAEKTGLSLVYKPRSKKRRLFYARNPTVRYGVCRLSYVW
jgi:hypothetical protein